MDNLEERFLVYTALLILCGTLGAFTGFTAAMWTFLQVATVVELVYWIGFDRAEDTANNC